MLLEPSNRAVTKLRYTPDKPYKLQINAVNSEVEIFGMTDDLYYIRSGKNYGFLPKQHLRETTRGNFPFQVEIDFSSKLINQQVREQNFLYEFLKSNQPAEEAEVKLNETVSVPAQTETLPAPVNEPSQENLVAKEAPLEPLGEVAAIDTIGTSAEIKSEPQVTQQPISKESEEDSGVDDDDDDDEDDEDDSEDEVEKKDEIEQPELIAIPPQKDPESAKIVETIKDDPKEEEKLVALPVEAASPEILPEQQSPPIMPVNADEVVNATVSETPKVEEEKVLEFIPISNEAVQEATILLESRNDTNSASQELDNKPEEVKTSQKDVNAGESTSKSEEIVQNLPNIQEPLAENASNETSTESSAIAEEPVTVETTPLSENPSELSAVEAPQQQLEVPELPIETETIERTIETNSKTQQSEAIPVSTEVPETIEILQPDVVEMPSTPIPLKPSPDALLQRFNEKLGNRVVEGTGKGSAEPFPRPDGQHHEHSHDNHDHHHEEKLPEPQKEKSPEIPLVDDVNDEPGFFGGLFKKFFSDADDSEQHFHEQAKPDNAFNPSSTDQKGE